MKTALTIFALAGSLAAGVVLAQSGQEVLKAKGCLNCHDAEKKKVGPSMKDIAAKHKDPAPLVAKLKEGKGHMKIAATDAEINASIQYVLSAK
jgi:cytochrome c